MNYMFSTKRTILLQLQPIRSILLILRGGIVSSFAFSAL